MLRHPLSRTRDRRVETAQPARRLDRMSTGTVRTRARTWRTSRPVDLTLQASLWFSFVVGYQLVQAGAGHNRSQALANGLRVADAEKDLVHRLLELPLGELARDSRMVNALAGLTYWSAEFAVVASALLWVYLRRPRAFGRFRNTLIVTNVVALVVFYFFPTAPPRTFSSLGFVDRSSALGHGLLPLPSNQYAAMPSLHSADALIVGVGLALLVRSRPAKVFWLLWPLVVWLSVMATANHFWLDVVGGIVVAAIGALAVGALGTDRLSWRRPPPGRPGQA
jgi:membrane-associated phospholipid phosphatase